MNRLKKAPEKQIKKLSKQSPKTKSKRRDGKLRAPPPFLSGDFGTLKSCYLLFSWVFFALITSWFAFSCVFSIYSLIFTSFLIFFFRHVFAWRIWFRYQKYISPSKNTSKTPKSCLGASCDHWGGLPPASWRPKTQIFKNPKFQTSQKFKINQT